MRVEPGGRKARPSLIPPDALLLVAQLMADGEQRGMGERWRQHSAEHHVDRAISHALQWQAGVHEGVDPDSGYSHLVNAAARLLLAVAVERAGQTPTETFTC